MTVWATEGDRGITGDYLSLGNQNALCGPLTKQHDAAHPVDNFFNSTISKGGVDVGGRTPNYSNQLGFDLATLNVPEGTIGNNQTAASVCLGTTGDTYFFGGLVFDTLIKAPNLHITKVADHTTANPGRRRQLHDHRRQPIDARPRRPTLRYAGERSHQPRRRRPASVRSRLRRASPTTAADDAPTAPRRARSPATWERSSPTPRSRTPTTRPCRHRAQGDTPASLANNACYDANSEDQPDVVFHGCDPATVVVPPAPPAPEPADLGVVKTVSHDIVKPGDTLTWTVVGTNYGPATSTGFVLADQLPAGMQFVSASASPELTCTTPPVGSSGSVTCTAPSVPAAPAAGSSLTLTIVATVPPTTADGSLLSNVATVSGDQDEPVPDPHPNRDETLTRVIVPDQPIPPHHADAACPQTRTARHSRPSRPCTRPRFPAARPTRCSS